MASLGISRCCLPVVRHWKAVAGRMRREVAERNHTGRAVAAPGFNLTASWVIHTVGPNRNAGQSDPALLRSAFGSSLDLARELECASVALPAISAGVYGWDAREVARIAVASARAHAGDIPGPRLIRFVLFSPELLQDFKDALTQ